MNYANYIYYHLLWNLYYFLGERKVHYTDVSCVDGNGVKRRGGGGMMKTRRLIRKDVNFRSDPIRKKKWEECERNEWKAQVTRRSTADNLMEDNF